MNRWGDSSDDEDVGVVPSVGRHTNTDTLKKAIPEPDNVQIPQKDAGLVNDAEAVTVGGDQNYEDFDRYGDEAPEANNFEADTDSEEDESERQLRIVAAKLKADRKRAESQKKKSSVKDQLADLDDILNEFGIDANAQEDDEEDEDDNDVGVEVGGDGTDNAAGTSGSSKRKKSKKKKKVVATNQLEQEQMSGEEVRSAPVNPNEAAKVLKLKAATVAKKKSKVNEAAAAAAKEMKSAASGVTKKKKKKDKQPQFGR